MNEIRRERIAARQGEYGGILCLPVALRPEAPLLVCVHGGGCDSRYFDLKSASFIAAAAQQGLACLLVDRPGYGTSIPTKAESPIAKGAEATDMLIRTVRTQPDFKDRSVAMIGHSIGGAVALTYAAEHGDHLSALCVSGIGDRPSAVVTDFLALAGNAPTLQPPPDWFFGPDTTYGWRGVVALRAAVQPWRADEVDEVIRRWPDNIARLAGSISCPVMVRLADHERIWEVTPQSIDRVKRLFTRISADVAILPAGGHLYEVHHRGPDLIEAQLNFIGANTSS